MGQAGGCPLLLTGSLLCPRKGCPRELPVMKRLGLVTREASSSSGFSGLGSNADFLLTCLMTVFRSGVCSNPEVCESLVTSHLLDS